MIGSKIDRLAGNAINVASKINHQAENYKIVINEKLCKYLKKVVQQTRDKEVPFKRIGNFWTDSKNRYTLFAVTIRDVNYRGHSY